jgi:hypothetical protein
MIMRPTSTYPAALDFLPAEAGTQARQRTLLAAARVVLKAMSDGLAAAHDYERLRARGLAPDAAVQRVFADHFETR